MAAKLEPDLLHQQAGNLQALPPNALEQPKKVRDVEIKQVILMADVIYINNL
jgi:hypothetical protein